jgi:putative hydrolase of the HAD superfamily
MREIFGRELADDEADAKFKVYLQAYNNSWQLYADVKPCLEALKGQPLGLISNGDGEQQRAKLEKFGLGAFFSVIIISREVDCAKPDKAIFELAAKQADRKLEDCVYVGDRLQADALGSSRAGMRGIWLRREGPPAELPAGIEVIQSLQELPKLIAH